MCIKVYLKIDLNIKYRLKMYSQRHWETHFYFTFHLFQTYIIIQHKIMYTTIILLRKRLTVIA